MSEYFQRGQLLLEQSRYDLAEREFRRELAENPDNALAHAQVAVCLKNQKRIKDARRSAQEGIRLGPDLSYCHYVHAGIQAEAEDLDGAEASIREAIRIDPEFADYYAALSAFRHDRRRWQESLDAAEEGLKIDPEHVACANLRAMSLVKLGRKDEAAVTIDTALKRDPENAITHANRGWTLLQAGDREGALVHFREALRLDPNLEWARQGVLESLKAGNVVYRVVLQYFFWMARLSARAQFGIIFGGWILTKILRAWAEGNPSVAPLVWPVIGLYIVFALLTWIADPVFNLFLRMNKFGRLVLSREQITATNWVGGCILLAVTGLGAGMYTKSIVWLATGLCAAAMTVPISATFGCQRPKNRKFLAAYSVGLAALAIAGIGCMILVRSNANPALACLGLFLIGWFAFQWIANFVALRN